MTNHLLTKNVKNNRESNYDLLRFICCIAVIFIHTSAPYIHAYYNDVDPYKTNIIISLLYNTLSRFAVPCFMMLSGAFLVGNDKNKDYKEFYHRSFIKIGIPTIIFSILYFVCKICIGCVRVIFRDESIMVLLKPLKEFIKGKPYYHMWYLYCLIGIYLAIPIIVRIRNDITEKSFTRFAWIYLITGMLSFYTSTSKLSWGVCAFSPYIGYVLVGYEIRKACCGKKNNIKSILFIISSVICLMLATYFRCYKYFSLESELEEKSWITMSYSALVVCASLMIFVGASLLSFSSSSSIVTKLSEYTFLIYILHAGILDIISKIWKLFFGMTDPTYTIPIKTIIVLAISLLSCKAYLRIWKAINKDGRVSNWFCTIFHI